MGEAKPIFRRKSLERLSTPDRLDQLLHVVKRRMWIPLLTLGGLLVLAVVWCFLGRVPITADAMAILVHPRSVVPVQSNAPGEILELDLQVGKEVKKDEIIAILGRPDLDEEIELQEERKAQFELRAATLEEMGDKGADREYTLIENQCELLGLRIESVRRRADALLEKSNGYSVQQRESLEETRRLLQMLDTALEERHKSHQTLLEEEHISKDTALGVEQRWYANKLGLADLEVKLQQLDLRELQAEAAHERQMDLVDDLEIQRKQFEFRRHEVRKTLDEAKLERATNAEEIRRTIKRLKGLREHQREIRADCDGRILEVTVSQGATIAAGQRIASLAKADPEERLRALAYFSVADGKKIDRDMVARVLPATAQQQRHGSIDATVVEFSEFPVTADAVATQVGNREMARMLVGDESRIEVTVDLVPDSSTKSGFRWSSAGGAGVEISPGTTARVRVTLEERAPITLLIPALRGWFGLD